MLRLRLLCLLMLQKMEAERNAANQEITKLKQARLAESIEAEGKAKEVRLPACLPACLPARRPPVDACMPLARARTFWGCDPQPLSVPSCSQLEDQLQAETAFKVEAAAAVERLQRENEQLDKEKVPVARPAAARLL
jgi:hypothetical protein